MYTHVQMLIVRFHMYKNFKIKRIIINLPINRKTYHTQITKRYASNYIYNFEFFKSCINLLYKKGKNIF